jgi:hypothetical protein
MTSPAQKLWLVKLVHTLAWAFFVACIVATPVAGWSRHYGRAGLFGGIVMIEVLILGLNGWRCPLTAIAARYTEDRRANFDIFLPEWLARYNKEVFGTLFVGGILLTLARWFG